MKHEEDEMAAFRYLCQQDGNHMNASVGKLLNATQEAALPREKRFYRDTCTVVKRKSLRWSPVNVELISRGEPKVKVCTTRPKLCSLARSCTAHIRYARSFSASFSLKKRGCTLWKSRRAALNARLHRTAMSVSFCGHHCDLSCRQAHSFVVSGRCTNRFSHLGSCLDPTRSRSYYRAGPSTD